MYEISILMEDLLKGMNMNHLNIQRHGNFRGIKKKLYFLSLKRHIKINTYMQRE